MKYAVVSLKGNQLKVSEGDEVVVDKLEREEGDKVKFDEVLLVRTDKKTEIGKPRVKGAQVTGKILEQAKGKKVEVLKYKAKSRYRRHYGHRRLLTRVRIEDISSK